MILTDILERNARMYGDETALIECEPAEGIRKSMTWTEFNDRSNRIANALIDRGIQKGDMVVQLMMNCIEWLPIYFGILKTGALAVPLNFRFSSGTIRLCSDISEARAFFFGEEFIDKVFPIKEKLDKTVSTYIYVDSDSPRPVFSEAYYDFLYSGRSDPPEVEIGPMDDAGLYFTSGTTGAPKAVLLTHRNLEFSCYAENRHHNQVHSDNFLLIPPLYHTGAKMHWFGNFIVGAKSVILKGVCPEYILGTVSREQCTIVWLLVPWAHDILIELEQGKIKLEDYNLDRWRLMHIGAQPVPPALIKRWKSVFPNHEYDTNYGLTEATGPGCVHLGIENMHKVGAIGVPGFDWECDIVDDKLRPTPLGKAGELIIKGPGVMKQYYKNPEENAQTLIKGWLRTGDIAKMDEDGFIWLVDRKKDVIITGGENIYPVEIEDFIINHDKIRDVAIIGAPDERLGEIVAAVVQFKPGQTMSEEEFFNFCQGLPKYKRPRRIFFGDVPRNPTGKIEKPKLREKYC